MKSPLHVGSEVKVKWRWDGFSGITRYCRPDQGEYVIGIERVTKDMQISALRTDAFREGQTINVASLKIVEKTIAPKAQESNPIERVAPSSKSGNVPVVPSAPAPAVAPETAIGHKTDSKDSPRESRSKEFDGSAGTEPPIKQPLPGKGRTQMSTKWLDTALGRQKQEAPEANTNGASVPGGHHPPAQASPTEKVRGNAVGISPVKSQGDLRSMDDIHHAARQMKRRMGNSIN